MAKFVAEKPDLDLELITLSGEEFELKPKIIINGKSAMDVVDKWAELEKAQKDEKTKTSPIEMIVKELTYIYDRDQDWWLDNFDIPTLNEILKYVAQTIGGIKKKLKN